MKNFFKKNYGYLLAFLIPIISFLVVIYCVDALGNGTFSLLTSDMYAQYVPLFAELKDFLTGNINSLYSFQKGIGGTLFGTFAYYLVSPLNLLVIFFKNIDFHYLFLLIIALKLGLSGVTSFIFFKHNFKKAKVSELLIFSTIYSLILYNFCYYIHIMWFDAIVLLPLVLLGIDKIIENKKSLLYGISLFLSILTNYYIGYMICITSVLYFIYKLFIKYDFKKEKDEMLKCLVKFGITSILSGFMAMILLIPTAIELMSTPKFNVYSECGNGLIHFNFDIITFLSRFFIGTTKEIYFLNYNNFHLYSSIIVIPLIIFYFINKNINKKEKILTAIFFSIFLLSFSCNYVNYFWHGLAAPQCFNGRYTFIFCLLCIYIAFKSYLNLNKIGYKNYFYIAPLYPILGLIIYFKGTIDLSLIYVSIAFYLFYLVLLYLVPRKEVSRGVNFSGFILLLVVGELIFSNFFAMRMIDKYRQDRWYGVYNDVKQEIDFIKEYDKTDDFYRLENTFSLTRNDSLMFDYNGIESFLSSVNVNTIIYFINTGYNAQTNNILYDGNNFIGDTLLGLKYQINLGNDMKLYNKINEREIYAGGDIYYKFYKDKLITYENPYALSLGYMVNEESKNFEDIFKNSKITFINYQNMLIKTMTDIEVLSQAKVNNVGENHYQMTIDSTDDFYFHIPLDGAFNEMEPLKIYFNDKLVLTYSYGNKGIRVIENNYEIGDVIDITFEQKNTFSIVGTPEIYYFDLDKFETAIDYLKEEQLDIVVNESDYLKGTINVKSDKSVLFTSIPYEDGWTVYVDGKKIEHYPLYYSFIGLDLDKGEHVVEFKYEQPGLKLGIIVSLISLSLFILYIKFEEKIVDLIMFIYKKYEEIINYLIIGVLTTLVSILSYALFTKLLNINYISSTVLSWVVSVIFAYITNKLFVFKSKSREKNVLEKEIFEFLKYRLLSLGIDVLLMYVLVSLLSINDMISKIIVQIVIIILNYVFSKLFVFKNDNKLDRN